MMYVCVGIKWYQCHVCMGMPSAVGKHALRFVFMTISPGYIPRNVNIHTPVQPKPANSDNLLCDFTCQPLSTISASPVLQHAYKPELRHTSHPTLLSPLSVTPLAQLMSLPVSPSIHPSPSTWHFPSLWFWPCCQQFVLISDCLSIPLNFCVCSHYKIILHVSTQPPLAWWGWTALNPKV